MSFDYVSTHKMAKLVVGFFAPISLKKKKWIRYYIRILYLSLALLFALTIAYLLIFVIVVVVDIIVAFSFTQFENRWVFFLLAERACSYSTPVIERSPAFVC